MYLDRQLIENAAFRLRNAKRAVAFTGAGISVDSGIPPFRGEDGIWAKYDPSFLELDTFLRAPAESWMVIKEIFYDAFDKAEPNSAHRMLAKLEKEGYITGVITQNIDHLHQAAGNEHVIEFHGNNQFLTCLQCKRRVKVKPGIFNVFPPKCAECGSVLKPEFVFYGEDIPQRAFDAAYEQTRFADVWLVIGTTGEVMPACAMPIEAKRNRAKIIEINTQPSQFTDTITDIFLQGKASDVLEALYKVLHGPMFSGDHH